MTSHFHIKILILILVFYCLVNLKASAQQKYDEITYDSTHNSSHFDLGFYAGLNSAFDFNHISLNPGASFMIYGTCGLSKRWKLEVGFGGMFFKGKSISFTQSRNVYDTIYQDYNTVTGLAYATIPVLFRYSLSDGARLLIGLRWMGVSEIYGNGNSGYYRPPGSKDSFITQSNIIPGLAKGANYMDIGGVAGFEVMLMKHFSISLKFNIGAIPIIPGKLAGVNGQLTGNYNNSIELGLNYEFVPK